MAHEEQKRWVRQVTQRIRDNKKEMKPAEPDKREVVEQRTRSALQNELAASSLLLSLFANAAKSYRRFTICEPFPPQFRDSKTLDKKFKDVEMYLDALPELNTFKTHPKALSNLPRPALDLLDWVVNPISDGFSLKEIELEQFEEAMSSEDTEIFSKKSRPSRIFELEYHEDCEKSNLFSKLEEEHGSFAGYHGSSLENIHSIVRNGLDETYAKKGSIYGEGIYLSENRDVAYNFLVCKKNDVESNILGTRTGCIAACRVLKHPEVRRYMSKTERGYKDSAILVDGDKQLPKGYVVANNNEYVLVKYVLLYSDSSGVSAKKKKRVNICMYMFFLYVFVILAIFLMRGNYLVRWGLASHETIEL